MTWPTEKEVESHPTVLRIKEMLENLPHDEYRKACFQDVCRGCGCVLSQQPGGYCCCQRDE